MPTNDIEIIIEGCNFDVCTSPSSLSSSSSSSFSPSLFVPFCGGGEEGGLVGEVIEEVEKKLEEGRLDEALGVLVAVGGVQDCSDIEVFVCFVFFVYFILFYSVFFLFFF